MALRISGSRACNQCPVQSNENPSITSVRTRPPRRSSASISVHASPSSRAAARPASPPPTTIALPPRRISTRLYHESSRRFVGGLRIPMLAWPQRHERDAVQPGAPRLQTSLGDGRVKISCPNCSAAYELDDARVPPSGLNIKCPKCKNPFTVHRPKGDAAKPPAKAGKAGPPGGKPAPPKMAPIQPPAKPKPGGAVPLPGMAAGPAAASSAFDLDPPAAPSAVALPGLDGGHGPQRTAVDFRPPTGPLASKDDEDGVVPLPGFEDQFGPSSAPA